MAPKVEEEEWLWKKRETFESNNQTEERRLVDCGEYQVRKRLVSIQESESQITQEYFH